MLSFVTNLYGYPSQPGRGLFNQQLIAAMRRCGESVAVEALVAMSNPFAGAAIAAWKAPAEAVNVTYRPYWHAPLIGRSWAAASATRALRAASFDQADVVLGSWLYPDGVAACRGAQQAGKPCWVMVLGTDRMHLAHPRRRGQIVKALAGAAGVICVADSIAAYLIEAGVPEDRVHVVHNGVDTERFKPQDREMAEAEVAASGCTLPAGRRILFLGNLVDVKGPDLALAVSEQLGAAGVEDYTLLVAGDGPMRQKLEARVESMDMSSQVCFLGRQPYSTIPALLNACDLLLLTSRSEGMPNVVVESRACGLPVVATDVGMCRDMLAGHEACAVVPAGDAVALAGAVRDVLGGPMTPRVSAFSRSWDDMASEMLALMR